MKAEKIEKHMRKRTVVAGYGGAWLGVIVKCDNSEVPAYLEGLEGMPKRMPDYKNYSGWFCAENVRKATDEERAAFFAWLVSDGTDISARFARFGGAPRGFEEWRTAQDAPAEPAPDVPVVCGTPTPPKPAFTVGQRVRLESGGGCPPLLGFTNGGIYTVRKVAPNESSVELELEPGESGFAAADQIEPAPEPVEPPASKHKRGDLRVCYPDVSTGLSNVGRVTSVNDDGDPTIEGALRCECCVYEPTRENVASLVAKQRERGIAPELGDLVFVIGEGRALERGAIALVTCAMDKLTLSVPVWGDISRQLCDVLVIRRNPLRELGDE